MEGTNDKNAVIKEIYIKLDELEAKEEAKYGKSYADWELYFASDRVLSLDWEMIFQSWLRNRLTAQEGNTWERVLRDETTWLDFHRKIEEQLSRGIDIPLSGSFMIHKSSVNLCRDNLGEDDPSTLKRTINLIRDYSLMGDAKTALAMEKNLLPKVEKAFGKDCKEVAELLSLMADDLKTLGDYRQSEEVLLKAIAIHKDLYGEENSPKLVANLITLINLRQDTPTSDAKLYDALDKAAANFMPITMPIMRRT